MSVRSSNPKRSVFTPGTLRAAIGRVTRQAEEAGALLSIPTEEAWVKGGEVELLVRVISSLARKDEERRQQAGLGDPTAPAHLWTSAPPSGASRPDAPSQGAAPRNPFLPYEEALYVADVSDTHVALLNKFNVAAEHLLVITRDFEDQRQVLGLVDFEALFRCLAEVEALGFYNGGLRAGASQPHKHLQMVPLPLASRGPSLPLGPLLDRAMAISGTCQVPGLPFRHAFCRLHQGRAGATHACWHEAEACYRTLLGVLGLSLEGSGEVPDPYNLLCTRDWMLLVPRIEECFEGISMNSLAFVGAFLVRDTSQMERLAKVGPLRALIHVAGPAGATR